MFFWSRASVGRSLAGMGVFMLLTVGLVPAGHWAFRWAELGPLWELRVIFVAVLGATLVVTLLVDRMPLAWSGLGIDRWSARHLCAGLAIGMVAALFAWVPAAMAGTVSRQALLAADAPLMIAAYLLAGAAAEELLFRGYLFLRTAELIGQPLAVLISSAVFAIGHAWNPSATPLGAVNVFLAGILFSLALVRSGALWLPIGLHFAWNAALALIVGAPVSGVEFGLGLVRTRMAGPDLLTGGDFGPEGGLAATAALLLALLAVMRWRATELSPYVHATVFRSVYRRQTADRAP